MKKKKDTAPGWEVTISRAETLACLGLAKKIFGLSKLLSANSNDATRLTLICSPWPSIYLIDHHIFCIGFQQSA